jgi:protein TonB
MNADVYTNNFFGFSYRVPAQWTGKAVQRSQPGQRFYQLLSALPAATGASIQYMGIQAEDIAAPVVKTASQFIQASPLAAANSAYESLGPIREMELGGHHFARADYRTKPSADDGGFTMFQTQLVTVLHNHAVTLSFTTDNQAALDQLAASASSMIFLSQQPAATPIPAAPAPAVARPAVAAATPAPAPAKARVAPEVTNGTVVMTFSDDPGPAKPAATTASAPVVQTPTPEPAKAEPVVQAPAQQVILNPAPAKIETAAANTPRVKPSAAIPINNILASNPEPVTVAKNDSPIVNAPAPDASPVATTAATSTPVAPSPDNSAPVNTAAAAEVVSDSAPATTIAISGITKISDTRMRLSEEALKEYIFSKSPMVYPQLAKQMNVQGSVVMQVVISMEGRVKDVKVISGAPQLQGTAVDSIRNWRFLPYLDNGRPMEVESQVSIAFKLGGR